MYCPQCGTESSPDQRFCRSCGANLKIIGKAVSLSEAVARSDRGPLPVIKDLMKSVKIKHTTEEISSALEQMNREIARSFSADKQKSFSRLQRKGETSVQRRENHIVTGMVSLFSGIALMIFLYYFSAALVLKIPPEKLAKLPFEIEPILKIIWLVGLIPTLSGFGRVIAGLMIKTTGINKHKISEQPEELAELETTFEETPQSVVERTTELLDQRKTLQ